MIICVIIMFIFSQLRILHYPPSPTGNIQLSYIEPQLVFCHNDLNPNNILYDPVTRQVSFIHLEFADMNFQAFEMARHFYTLCGSDLSRVGSSDFVPAPEFQFRWCQYYIAAYENILVKEVSTYITYMLLLYTHILKYVFLNAILLFGFLFLVHILLIFKYFICCYTYYFLYIHLKICFVSCVIG